MSKKEGRVNTVQLASLRNSSGLWGTGLVPNCLVSVPVLIKGRENVGFMYESKIKDLVGSGV